MTKQIIDIGVQGNDGTGDSIRESFRKVNENFTELYAVFGAGGRINFTSLGDAPETYGADQILMASTAGDRITARTLVAGSGITITGTAENSPDNEQLTISATLAGLFGDDRPALKVPLNARLQTIGLVPDPSPEAVAQFNAVHGSAFTTTIDQLAIPKGYADRNYLAVTEDGQISRVIKPREQPLIPDVANPDYDGTLTSNYLSTEAMQRKDIVYRGGDTMTGKLFLADHPAPLEGYGTPTGASDLQAATKFYVDNQTFSSGVNLYVSTTSGDDLQQKTPVGKEGRFWQYAYKSVGAACLAAENLINLASQEPGPYRQKLSFTIGPDQSFSTIVANPELTGGNSENTGFTDAFDLLQLNRTFIQAETIAYINNKYVNSFRYDKVAFQNQINAILDSVGYDLVLGTDFNTVTTATNIIRTIRPASLTQTVDAIRFARDTLLNYAFDEDNLSAYIGDVVDALCFDLIFQSNYQTIQAGLSFPTAETGLSTDQMVQVISDLGNKIINLPEIAALIAANSESDSVNIQENIAYLVSILLTGELPNVVIRDLSGTSVGQSSARDLLLNNIGFLQAETIAYLGSEYPNLPYNRVNYQRDVKYLVWSIVYDMVYGGNQQSILTANRYWLTSSITATATNADTDTITVTSTNNLSVGQPIVFRGTGFGNIVPNTVYYVYSITNNVTFSIANSPTGTILPLTTATGTLTLFDRSVSGIEVAPLIDTVKRLKTVIENVVRNTTPPTLYQQSVKQFRNDTLINGDDVAGTLTVTGVTSTGITVGSTENLEPGLAVVFEGTGALATSAGIAQGFMYYVKNVVSETKFTITATKGGVTEITLTPQSTGTLAASYGISANVLTVANIILDDRNIPIVTANVSASSVILQSARDTILNESSTYQTDAVTFVNNEFPVINDAEVLGDIENPEGFNIAGIFQSAINLLEDGLENRANPGFTSPVGLSQGKTNARALMLANLDFIADETIGWLETNRPAYVFNATTMARNIKDIVEATCYEMTYSTIGNTVNSATVEKGLYLKQFIYNQVTLEIDQDFVDAISFAQNLTALVVENTEPVNNYSLTLQVINLALTSGAESINSITSTFGGIKTIAQNIGVLPSVFYPVLTSFSSDLRNTRTLIITNRSDISNSTISYIDRTYVGGFNYDESICRRDVGLMVDGISIDLVTGGTWQAVAAGKSYYRNSSAKAVAIGTQFTETFDAINFVKELIQQVLSQETATRYQTLEAQYFNEEKLVSQEAKDAAEGGMNIILDIIRYGVGAAPAAFFGSGIWNVQISNGGNGYVDQGQPGNLDIIPAKVIVGIESQAYATIVKYVPGVTTGIDTIQVRLTKPGFFQIGEELEFGETIKDLNITIQVESGIYFEDFPIRVPQNVSIRGDEFRRTIIRPLNRISQSPWRKVFFYRDAVVDAIELNGIDKTYDYDNDFATDSTVAISGTTGSIVITLGTGQVPQSWIGKVIMDDYVVNGNAKRGRASIDSVSGNVMNCTVIYPFNDPAYATNKTISNGNWHIYDTINYGRFYLTDPLDINSPAKNNTEIDVLLTNDANRVSNLTFQRQGGFAMVLDPEGQIKTKSPYGQVCSSFSQSTNFKRFAGGQFVDGFAGRLWGRIIDVQYDSITEVAEIIPGSGYTSGTYTNVPLVGTTETVTGVQATANLTVVGGSVIEVEINNAGIGYKINDGLTAAPGTIGDGDGFLFQVSGVTGVGNGITVTVQGQTNSGLDIRPPQPPCAFFVQGVRYQVNDVVSFDKNTATVVLTMDVETPYNASAQYNNEEFSRDLGIVIDSATYDLVLGSNFQTVRSGYFYGLPQSVLVSNLQKNLTLNALTKAEELILENVTDENIQDEISASISTISTIVDQGFATAPAITYPTSVNTSASAVKIKNYLLANKTFLEKEIAAWIADNFILKNYPGYTSVKTERDISLIVDSVIYDTMYGGNSMTYDISLSFYGMRRITEDKVSQLEGYAPLYTAAMARLRTVMQQVISATTANVTRSPGNIINQIVNSSFAVSTGDAEYSKVGQLIDIVEDFIADGDFDTLTTRSNPTLTGLDSGKLSARTDILAEKDNISLDVIDYVNTGGGLRINIEMGGNKSMLANDFAMINDLGYAIFCTNGGLSEQVSTFTYYCHTHYWANNGGQIRSVAGSNAHGTYGLRASGYDVTEKPDSVSLAYDMVQPARVYKQGAFSSEMTPTATKQALAVYITQYSYIPFNISELEIDHTSQGGLITRYEVTSIEYTAVTLNGFKVLKLNLSTTGGSGTATTGLQAPLVDGQVISIRVLQNLKFNAIDNVKPTRPSTALQFNDNLSDIYRILAYGLTESTGELLGPNIAILKADSSFNYYKIATDVSNLDYIDPDDPSKTMGSKVGDYKIAVVPIGLQTTIDQINKSIYITAYAGRTHRILNYTPAIIRPTGQYSSGGILPNGDGDYILAISSVVGFIQVGMIVSGEGYTSGQTVVSITPPVDPSTIWNIEISGPADSQPSGSISFGIARPAFLTIEPSPSVNLVGEGSVIEGISFVSKNIPAAGIKTVTYNVPWTPENLPIVDSYYNVAGQGSTITVTATGVEGSNSLTLSTLNGVDIGQTITGPEGIVNFPSTVITEITSFVEPYTVEISNSLTADLDEVSITLSSGYNGYHRVISRNSSTQLTVASTTGLVVGMVVSTIDANAFVSNGTVIQSIDSSNQFTVSPAVWIPTGAEVSSTLAATLSSVKYLEIDGANPGAGYTQPPIITFGSVVDGGADAQAVATCTIDEVTGSINGITIVYPGFGYISVPDITVTGGNPRPGFTPASLIAVLTQTAQRKTTSSNGVTTNQITVEYNYDPGTWITGERINITSCSSVTGAGPYAVVLAFSAVATAPQVGSRWTIAGNTNALFNGLFEVTASSTTSMTLQYLVSPGTSGSFGTTVQTTATLYAKTVTSIGSSSPTTYDGVSGYSLPFVLPTTTVEPSNSWVSIEGHNNPLYNGLFQVISATGTGANLFYNYQPGDATLLTDIAVTAYVSKTGTGPFLVRFTIPDQEYAPTLGSIWKVSGNVNTLYNATVKVVASSIISASSMSVTFSYDSDPGDWDESGGNTKISNKVYLRQEAADASTNALGINKPFDKTNAYTLRLGFSASTPGQVTTRISTCRATGHDFLDIGTGSYSTTNYPAQIYGNPAKSKTGFAGEVKEEGVGRVFHVSTDQDGIFRVGRFFTVDQGTGTVTYAGSIALSNLDGLGFKRGTVINEFSTDTSMTNNAPEIVPTQSAVRGFVDRRLGLDYGGGVIPKNQLIGPGYLALNGSLTMTGSLNMGNNTIGGVAPPVINNDVATKLYVDQEVAAISTIDKLQNVVITSPNNGSLLVFDDSIELTITGAFGNSVFVTVQFAPLPGNVVPVKLTQSVIISGVVNLGTETDLYNGVYSVTFADATSIRFLSPVNSTYISGGTIKVAQWKDVPQPTGDVDTTYDSATSSLTTTIQSQKIVDSMIKNTAAIQQSKLLMTKASARAASTGLQADLGLATFDNNNFTVTDGFVSLTAGSVSTAQLSNMATNRLLGNFTGTPTFPREVTPDDVVENGDGIKHAAFGTNVGAMVRTGTKTYTVVALSATTSASSIVQRDTNGKIGSATINAGVLEVGGFKTQDLSSTTFNFYTPGQYNYATVTGTSAANTTLTLVGGTLDTTAGTLRVDTITTGGSATAGTIVGNWQVLTSSTFDVTNGTLRSKTLSTGADDVTGSIQGRWSLLGASRLEATYADLAEFYEGDKEYEPGTVLVFGGDKEVTITNQMNDTRAAGVVTTNPAYVMNQEQAGIKVCIALAGRVPCKVVGRVKKGDLLTTSATPGYAVKANDPKLGSIIGKALEDKDSGEAGVIQVAIGRV
jgi:hypothetical protein